MGIESIVNELENVKTESKEYRRRLKVLTQLYILCGESHLLDDITNLYNFIVNCTNYPEGLLRVEMADYKKKLITIKELEDTNIFPTQREI